MGDDQNSNRDVNPFAAPRVTDAVNEVPVLPHEIKVQGQYLVVGQRPVLPDRCVSSNEPTLPRHRKQYRLEWAPSFRLTMRREKCHPIYSLGRRYRRSLILRRLAFATAVGIVVVLFQGISIATLTIVTVCLLQLLRQPNALSVHREHNGRFWLRGCGYEFLKSCAEEFGTYDGPVGGYD